MNRPIFVIPLAFVLACAHSETKKETAAPMPMAAPASTSDLAGPPEKTCSSDLDCGAKQLCVRSHCVDITPGLAECATQVHFPFNSAEIEADERPALERSARCLKAAHSLHVTIEGNADERGTEEYNLALGDRRAAAVAKYLSSLGASNSQLKTVSYGKDNPLCTEHDENCWAKNRRAALRPIEASKSGRKP